MTGGIGAALLVGVGGAGGAVARHAVGSAIDGRESVVAVNLLGSFVLGVVSGLPVGSAGTFLVGVGFCGAFTTFSSFAVETVTTAESGDLLPAIRFATVNLVGAIAALLLGSLLVTAVP